MLNRRNKLQGITSSWRRSGTAIGKGHPPSHPPAPKVPQQLPGSRIHTLTLKQKGKTQLYPVKPATTGKKGLLESPSSSWGWFLSTRPARELTSTLGNVPETPPTDGRHSKPATVLAVNNGSSNIRELQHGETEVIGEVIPQRRHLRLLWVYFFPSTAVSGTGLQGSAGKAV